jgi:hypothetical protein
VDPVNLRDLIPPGVTKRGVDTLVSRRVAPFSITASAVVSCPHGRVKRVFREVHVTVGAEVPVVCMCCENIYAARDDTPPGTRCRHCNPREAVA